MFHSKEGRFVVLSACVLFFLVEYTSTQYLPDASCKDVLPNCAQYKANGACHGQYEPWARQNCNLTCHYCVGVEPPCEDQDANCENSDTSVCSNPAFQNWAEHTCRFTCRRCSAQALAVKLATMTTLAPALCKDKLDCRLYGNSSCSGKFLHWAKENCMQYCGFCKGIPTPPSLCVDTIPNCVVYGKATCSNSKYTLWSQDKCRKYCGLCGGSVAGSVIPGGMVPTPIPWAIPGRK